MQVVERRWGRGSDAQTNKSASAPLPHRRCPSWRRLRVDDIMCSPIPRIGGLKFLIWCRRGGGDDPITCVHPSALSLLLRHWLRPHDGAEDVLSRVRADSCQMEDGVSYVGFEDEG
jgi:hypothetical protein